jgi:hypothetical protein
MKHAEKELNAAKVMLALFEEKALAEETFAKSVPNPFSLC